MRTLSLSAFLCFCVHAQDATVNSYTQTNLTSDIPGFAAATEPLLVNPWGLTRPSLATAHDAYWWAADQRTGVSTLYKPDGSFVPLVITIPSAGAGVASPAGAAFFQKNFVFASLDGTISQWFAGTKPSPRGTGCAGCHTTSAVMMVNHSANGAVYTGITEATNSGGSAYYVANAAGGVEAFSTGTFAPITLSSGAFLDPQIPAGANPFGIQRVGTRIYVTFYNPAQGGGFVDAFDSTGKLVLRLQSGNWFAEPWGIAHAPAGFGKFSNAVLVGNVTSGQIAAFNSLTGRFLGFLEDSSGTVIANPGLWAIYFGAGNAESGPKTILHFAAGIDSYTHGLFGSIAAN